MPPVSCTYLYLILEGEPLPLQVFQLPLQLVSGHRVGLPLLLQRPQLRVELPLLLLEQSVARGLLLQQQLSVVHLPLGLLGLPLPRGHVLTLLVNFFVGIVELREKKRKKKVLVQRARLIICF